MTDSINDMENIMRKSKRIPKKQQGGLLVGPSHEEGGIGAVISGGDNVELEGGEYIVNAQTVDALGVQFLDKLNSTQTTYHTGGFGAGELPGPSQYRNGGQIGRNNMRRRKMAGGGSLPYNKNVYNNPYRKGGGIRRKFEHGGSMGSCPPGMHMMPDGRCMEGAYHGANNSYRHGGYHAIPGTGGPGMPPPSIPDIMSGGAGFNPIRPGIPGIPYNPADVALGSGRNNMGKAVQPAPRNRRREYGRGGMTRPRRRFAHGGYHSNGMRNGCAPGEYCHGGEMNQYGHGGGIYAGSPNSCTDGMGNNVPC